MPKREDPAMQLDQPPGPDALANQIPTQAQREELPPGNDTVLTLGQLANRCGRKLPRCGCNALGAYFAPNALHPGERVRVPRREARQDLRAAK
ncbi:MAG: hypothetical protein ACM3N0_02250 [Chloroflexota bacterium]